MPVESRSDEPALSAAIAEAQPAVAAPAPVAEAAREAVNAPPAPAEIAPRETTLPVDVTPIPHEPQVIASFAAPPATYQVVSEHDQAAAAEPHRPVRRRRQESAAQAPTEPLQLVETAAEKAAAIAAPAEEEAPRRPVRRRRQAAAALPDEPLQLVETAPGAARPDAGPPPA